MFATLRVPNFTTQRRAALVAAGCALALFGCTGENPDYVADGGTSADLGPGPGGPDLSPNESGFCAKISRACEKDCVKAAFASDRRCPADSSCAAGYCQVPGLRVGTNIGIPCQSEAQCFTSAATFAETCMPFVVGGRVQFYCDMQIGGGASGASCKTGNDCRTGFCLADRGTCFRACSDGSDCPPLMENGVSIKLVCQLVQLTVEGAAVSTTSCVKPK